MDQRAASTRRAAWRRPILLLLAAAAVAGSAGAPATGGDTGRTVFLGGVLYDPATAPEVLSMVPHKFEASIELDGKPIELAGDFASWIVGVVSVGPGTSKEQVAANCRVGGQPPGAECGIRIVRFGQYGTVQKPTALTWLVELEGSETAPAGRLTASLDASGRLVFPAKVHYDLDLVFTLQRAGERAPLTVRSRTPAAFDGTVDGWPLGLTLVSLANGPVAYVREAEAADPGAKPLLVLRSATMAFADKPSEFFRNRPEITRAEVVDPAGAAWRRGAVGGVALAWSDTAAVVTSSHVHHFNVYRSLGDGPRGGWKRIATVPATQATFTDREFDGKTRASYLVTHDVDYPFERRYEGIYGPPKVVAPVVK